MLLKIASTSIAPTVCLALFCKYCLKNKLTKIVWNVINVQVLEPDCQDTIPVPLLTKGGTLSMFNFSVPNLQP